MWKYLSDIGISEKMYLSEFVNGWKDRTQERCAWEINAYVFKYVVYIILNTMLKYQNTNLSRHRYTFVFSSLFAAEDCNGLLKL